MKLEFDFSGKVAISTGAASGMGLLFAENIADRGGDVVLCDINRGVIEEKAEEINARGKGRAIAVACDVTDYSEVCRVRDTAISAFGRIDIVANFAGGFGRRLHKIDSDVDFTDVPIEVYDASLNLNLKAPFYFAHAVLGVMKKQNSGLIINIGSITGMEGSAYGMDYPVAKAGLMFGLTKSIAQYGEGCGIRCVCISPGPVLTRPAMAEMRTLAGRAADPQEIIDLCLFVASENGEFINGENIMIDGGRNAMGRWDY